MWDYHEIPAKRQALEEMTNAKRDAMTWVEARSFLLADTLAIAMFHGMSVGKERTPFEAVCIANGFYDLVKSGEINTTGRQEGLDDPKGSG